MRKLLALLAVLVLLLPLIAADAAPPGAVNPVPYSVWTYYGATLGAGWAPPTGGGNVSGMPPTTVGDCATWNNTSGTALIDGPCVFGQPPTIIGDVPTWANTTGTLLAADGPGTIRGLTINPPPSTLNTGLTVTQSWAGNLSTSTGINYNLVNVTDTACIVSPPGNCTSGGGNGVFGVGFGEQLNVGGSTVMGGREGAQFIIGLNAPTNANNPNRYYVAAQMLASANSGDGGTGVSYSTAKGALIGAGSFALANSGATNLANLNAEEFNVASASGSSGWLKEGIAIVTGTADAGVFQHNVLLDLSGASNASMDTGISFSDYHGAQPFTTTACLICAQSETAGPGTWTVATGIDLSKFYINGNLLKGNGVVYVEDQSANIAPPAAVSSWAMTDDYLPNSSTVNLWNLDTVNGIGGFDVWQQTSSGPSQLFSVNRFGAVKANVGPYEVAGSVGVNCPAGSVNLSTLTVTGGIVTHC